MRFVAGILLLVAVSLKALSPAESLSFESDYGLPLGSSAALIASEWLLGVLLVAGLWQRQTIGVALVGFTTFALFSLYRGLVGAESCGCFGTLEVNPWLTFVLDVVIAAALCRTWMRLKANEAQRAEPVSPWNWRRTTVTSAFAMGIVPLLAWSAHSRPTRLAAESELLQEGGLVILEPEAWLGKRFPLAAYIEQSGADLRKGNWTVVLYHHDCPKCQEALPQYQRLAEQLEAAGSSERVMLVEMPPFGSEVPADGAAQAARLSDEREWFVQAPVEIRLVDGKVVASSLDLPALTALAGPVDRWASFEH
jgi:hypothetical protein